MYRHYRKTNRIQGFQYGTPGCYFITICTYQKLCFLGRVINNEIVLSETGDNVKTSVEFINIHYQNAELSGYVIMPNHVHMVIDIEGAGSYSLPDDTIKTQIIEEQESIKEMGTNTITIVDIVRNFKTFTGNSYYEEKKCNLWQRGYYDHIIRDSDDRERILHYIHDNPTRWQKDKFYCEIMPPEEIVTGNM